MIGFILLLGGLVFFHELGHFVVAKACGVRVLTFSIGFGPRLVGFTHGDTDYRISLIPLGGYVRMYGDNLEEVIPEDQKQYTFLHKGYWQKSAIAFAGPFFNFILPIFIFFFLFLGTHQVPDTIVRTAFPQDPAGLAGMKAGDKLVDIDGTKVSSFIDVQEIVTASPDQTLQLTVERDGQRLALNVTPERVLANPKLGQNADAGRLGIMPSFRASAVSVIKDSPASAAQLPEIAMIEGYQNWEAFQKAIQQFSILMEVGNELELRFKPIGPRQQEADVNAKTVNLVKSPFEVGFNSDLVMYGLAGVERDGRFNRLQVQTKLLAQSLQKDLSSMLGFAPAEGRIQNILEKTAAEGLGLVEGDIILGLDGHTLIAANELRFRLQAETDKPHFLVWLHEREIRIGAFMMGPHPKWGLEEVKISGLSAMSFFAEAPSVDIEVGAIEALRESCNATWNLLKRMTMDLVKLFTFQQSPKAMGGVVMIYDLADKSLKAGWDVFMERMALISVSLGLINLVPVPVLDGGHLLMFFIEAVTRKKLSVETRMKATKIGFFFLLGLMALALFNDVMRLFN